MVPLSAIARFAERATPTSISHQDAAVATTISFNAADGVALSDAEAAVRQAEADIAMPTSIAGSFEGTARAAKDRSEEHTSELQSLMRSSYAVFCLKKKK